MLRDQFPILYQGRDLVQKNKIGSCWPTSIPLGMLVPHEYSILQFHNQTIELLASRGGLSPAEIVFHCTGKPLSILWVLTTNSVIDWLVSLIKAYDQNSSTDYKL